MKKSSFIILWIFFSVSVSGQLTLSESYNYSTSITKINDTDYKYFQMDVPAEQCRLYNPDFSLFKSINLNIPEGQWLYDIRFVSEALFHSDSNIELLYTYYKWFETNATSGEGYYIYHSKIINENGTELLDAPGALYSYVNQTGQDEYSLFLYIYDLSTDPYTIRTNIYKLPGKPQSQEDNKKSLYSIDSYPNPADDFIIINYQLPPNIESANLHLVDASGREQAVFKVDGFKDHLRLESKNFLPGIYFFFLENNGRKSDTKKIIIQ